MKRTSTSELEGLEVINLCGGERLGYPCDFEIDLNDGKLIGITVKGGDGFAFFSKREEYYIPWCKIDCIGEDAILVNIPRQELQSCCIGSNKGKKGKKCR